MGGWEVGKVECGRWNSEGVSETKIRDERTDATGRMTEHRKFISTGCQQLAGNTYINKTEYLICS
jgi:hypothetical protein